MYQIIETYISLIENFNNGFECIEDDIRKFNYIKFQKSISDLPLVLKDLGILFPIGILFDYYKYEGISRKNTIHSELELNNFLKSHKDIIICTGGLNCYIDIGKANQFLQLHYQDVIILYTKQLP